MVKDLKKKARKSKTIETACMVHHPRATWRVPLPKTKHVLGVYEDAVTSLLRQATSCKYVTTLYNQHFPFRPSSPGWNPSAVNPSSNPSDPLTLNLICRLEMGDSPSPKASLCTNCTRQRSYSRIRDKDAGRGGTLTGTVTSKKAISTARPCSSRQKRRHNHSHQWKNRLRSRRWEC